jgi:hypothetical protein
MKLEFIRAKIAFFRVGYVITTVCCIITCQVSLVLYETRFLHVKCTVGACLLIAM